MTSETYEEYWSVTSDPLHATETRSWTPDKVMSVIYIIIGVFGLVGNIFVILVNLTYTSMQKQLINLLMINQSLIDSFSSVVLIMTVTLADRGRVFAGISGMLLCRFWYSTYFLWSSLVASTFNLLFIAFERYFCIVKPILYKTKFNRRIVLIFGVTAWLLGFGLQLLITVLPSGVDDNGGCSIHYYWPSATFQQTVGVLTIVLCFLCPLLAMCVCYVRMVVALQTRIDQHDSSAPTGQGKIEKARRNLIKTLVTVTACFIICWLPNQIVFFAYNLGFYVSFTAWYYHLTILLVYLNCCCNPLIYVVQYEQFRAGIRGLMTITRRWRGSDTSDTTTSTT